MLKASFAFSNMSGRGTIIWLLLCDVLGIPTSFRKDAHYVCVYRQCWLELFMVFTCRYPSFFIISLIFYFYSYPNHFHLLSFVQLTLWCVWWYMFLSREFYPIISPHTKRFLDLCWWLKHLFLTAKIDVYITVSPSSSPCIFDCDCQGFFFCQNLEWEGLLDPKGPLLS